jgi:hypothetical protein
LRSIGGEVTRLTQRAAGIGIASGVCEFKPISLACTAIRESFRDTM